MNRKKPVDNEWLATLKAKIKESGGQKRVSELSGVNQSSVSKFLNGRDVKVSTAKAILAVVGMDVDDMPEDAADQAEGQIRARILEQQLADEMRRRTEMQVRIMTAVATACRVAGLSVPQKEMIQAAVFDYEKCQDEAGVRAAAERYASRQHETDAAMEGTGALS